MQPSNWWGGKAVGPTGYCKPPGLDKDLNVGNDMSMEDSYEMVGVRSRHVLRIEASSGRNERLSRSIGDCGGSEALRSIPRGRGPCCVIGEH